MEIARICSTRKYDSAPWMDIIYEWEDVFSSALGIPLADSAPIKYSKFMGKVYRRLPFLLRPRATSRLSFQFELVLDLYCRPYNRRNIVPCIVDFFLKKRLRDFINNYRRNPAVLVSSLEAYEFIQKTGLAKHVNTRHLALSLPDAYRLHPSAVFEKKYDLALCGRQNPVLRGFMEQYLQTHPDFHYVYWKDENGKRVHYTSTGECLGTLDTREQYINLVRQSRVGLYNTPGIDGGEARTLGLSQVTPRFLELLACGCHVIARYKENPDTEYYELNRFSPSVASYGQFEEAMDNALATEPDLAMYASYLENHYTSRRAQELKSILEKL